MHEKVVIIGGGFGGLTIAQCLAKSDKKVTLIDRTNHHLFQPLLYQVATAALSSSDIAVPIRQVLQGQKNTEVVMGEVRLIDRGKREVVLADGRNYVFDRLVVAIGSEPGYFGKDDWRKHSLALKTLNDAFAIKERILLSYEIAESSSDQVEREKNLTFVIVGGGPTGVELAGAIADIANHTLLGNFRHIDPSSTRIYLIEGGDRILAQFSE
ncbi:MAG: FAD-dependent oxidoreductase, partial [Desulfobacterales bacterium]|nr:FAD-dependent oxidoreductase [Desulfobacterales bacterium]